jgi:hypothetical protein
MVGGGGGGKVPSPLVTADAATVAALGSGAGVASLGSALLLTPDNWHVASLRLYTGSAYVWVVFWCRGRCRGLFVTGLLTPL